MRICTKFFFATKVIFILTACIPVDDQRLQTPEMRALTDASPPNVDYQAVNARHQILVAVIDSGVEYRHPYLAQNIHYSLDTKGELKGIGYDFVADDSFPLPYLARTSSLAKDAKMERVSDGLSLLKTATIILSRNPDLKAILNPIRAWEQESAVSAHHGTHVAGLITYDEPRIGLIPYRVLPDNEPWAKKDPVDHNFAKILAAMEQSVNDGARVVNMSIGALSTKSKDEENLMASYLRKMGDLVRANPEVVFVAATGNEGSWVDARSRMSLPCGVPNVENLICVSALDANDQVSEFSNIPLMNVPVVFALGENLISTLPENMCSKYDFEKLPDLEHMESDETANNMADEVAAEIRRECLSERGDLGELSGTSMATPLVARLAAQALLANPALSAKEVIANLIESGTKDRIGPLEIIKLKIKKPSWYREFKSEPGSVMETLRSSMKRFLAPEEDYFEISMSKKI